MGIEIFGIIVFRMDKQAADTGDVGHLEGSADGICDQRGTQALALPALVHGKPGEQQNGDGMEGNALGEPFRGIGKTYIAYNQGMISDHTITDRRDISLRDIGPLSRQSMQADEIV